MRVDLKFFARQDQKSSSRKVQHVSSKDTASMATFLALPILGVALMIQTAILSQVPLLKGPADLVLLTLLSWVLQQRVGAIWWWATVAGLLVGWVSALPVLLTLAGYLAVTGLAVILRNRVWQIPILALFITIIFGSLITQGSAYLYLRLGGTPLDLQEALNLIILPSLLLNLLIAIPVNGIISELASWLYPPEIEA
jgi:cell shape-determining protein MreD